MPRKKLSPQEQMSRFAAFKADLLALMEKHQMGLYCNIDGDTHGIYEEGFSLEDYQTSASLRVTCSGFGLDARDLEDVDALLILSR